MSTSTNNTQNQMGVEEANATLISHVAVPAFFEKLAQDTGTTPSSEGEARSLLNTGDLIKAAVDLYIQREFEASKNVNAQTVKAAVDAAYEVAGINLQPQINTTTPDFLKDDAVKLAAATLLAAQKQANMTPPMPVPPMTEEEEEEEKKKQQAAA